MRNYTKFYIDGAWVEPSTSRTIEVINPATEQPNGIVAMGTEEDVNRAVSAARRAFTAWSTADRQERIEVMQRIIAECEKRSKDIADAITAEMGAPTAWSTGAQVPFGLGHMQVAAGLLEDFTFEEKRKDTVIRKEPIGVCSLITPWNWPLNQIFTKVAPALATGCTMVLKPSELAPFSAYIVAEIFDAAGVPAGVFNLVNGDGQEVGAAMSRHPQVDMVSFTGSTRAGIEVAKNAAPTIKRVHQELGGKGPNIILDDDTFAAGVAGGVENLMSNTGQSCAAPSRMLIPANRMDEAIEIAAAAAAKITVGDPLGDAQLGPVISQMHWTKIQGHIQSGIDEGANMIIGGLGRPSGLDVGYYVQPTVFANVGRNMKIAREEIFGPVLVMMAYSDIDEAIEIANDTEYGLASYVWGDDTEIVRSIANQIRSGMVFINGGNLDLMNPFGGYKMSGNGREWGDYAFHDFLETKAIMYPG